MYILVALRIRRHREGFTILGSFVGGFYSFSTVQFRVSRSHYLLVSGQCDWGLSGMHHGWLKAEAVCHSTVKRNRAGFRGDTYCMQPMQTHTEQKLVQVRFGVQ